MTILTEALIVSATEQKTVTACIRAAKTVELPTLGDGWIFDFKRQSQLPLAQTYVLTTLENSTRIEGCLIFELKIGGGPWMSFVEVAPHNTGSSKQYEHVGTCLIMWACELSLQQGTNHNKGFLMFEVAHQPFVVHEKLTKLYRQKYGAIRYATTDKSTVFLMAQHQKKDMINHYLRPKNSENH